MGGYAARKALEVVENVERVIGIELYCAVQALHLLGAKEFPSTKPINAVFEAVAAKVDPYLEDRITFTDQDLVIEMVQSGEILDAVLGCGVEIPDLY